MKENNILLNDILQFQDLSNMKIRFNLMFEGNWNPTDFYKNAYHEKMINGHYHNYKRNKSFKEGQITLGFIKLESDDLWLLFHVGKVTKDLNIYEGSGYEYKHLEDYEKYCGRIIIRYKNKSQNLIRLAESVINDCVIEQILPNKFNDDIFPGYENVDISWNNLSRVVNKESWRVALGTQKGVYLITDTLSGKMYVGSAYGENMILGRWKSYIQSYHGGNVKLKELENSHIKNNFRFSILDIFKATTDDKVILKREAWWKSILQTKEFGYNLN